MTCPQSSPDDYTGNRSWLRVFDSHKYLGWRNSIEDALPLRAVP